MAEQSKQVDVLAVMDSAAQHAATLRTYARDTGAFRVTNAGASALAEACAAALAAIEARAAVAELVEKADTIATALSNLIAAQQVDAGYGQYVTDLTAALTRIAPNELHDKAAELRGRGE